MMTLHSQNEVLDYAQTLAKIEDVARANCTWEISDETFVDSVLYFLGLEHD